MFYCLNKSPDGETSVFINRTMVQRYTTPAEPPVLTMREPKSDPSVFCGPKLKFARAMKHIREVEFLIASRNAEDYYGLTKEMDPETGDNVYRVVIKKPERPDEYSSIIGDAVHNLRCVLDYLVCDLIRSNGNEPGGNSGLPIDKRPYRYKPGRVPKISGVSPKAERILLRLKAGPQINRALYALHMLDIMDKHNTIVTTAAATVDITAKVGIPGFFKGADGNIRVLGPGPGGVPFMVDAGIPAQYRSVFPLANNMEIYRSPAGFLEEISVDVDVVFGRGELTTGAEGLPVVTILLELASLVERTIELLERRAI